MRPFLPLTFAIALAGCGYRAGTYRFIGAEFPAAHARAGCLDIGVGGHQSSRDDTPVVAYALGNRCDMSAEVDLSAVRAWGIVASGERIPLIPRDPRGEIGRREIAATWAGRAAIEYLPAPRGSRPIFVEVCVDLAGIVPELTSFQHCFDPRVSGGPS